MNALSEKIGRVNADPNGDDRSRAGSRHFHESRIASYPVGFETLVRGTLLVGVVPRGARASRVMIWKNQCRAWLTRSQWPFGPWGGLRSVAAAAFTSGKLGVLRSSMSR